MKKRYPKQVNPQTMITRFEEIFKPIGMKKPTFRNLLFILIAISVAKTFRINQIAARLPIVVAREKSLQKRFLRFLETPGFPVDALKAAYFVSVVCWFSKDTNGHLYLLVDERDLLAGWKAIVSVSRWMEVSRNLMTLKRDGIRISFIRRTSRYPWDSISSETKFSKTRCILSQIASADIKYITATNAACKLNTASEI